MATRRPTPHRFSPHIAGVAATFLLVALHMRPSFGQEEPPPWLLCGSDDSRNYTANSPYEANINRLAATLPKNASSSPVLYASDSAGSIPDRVYALAACRGDANASACERCVAAAFPGARRGCSLAKDVLIFYDLCQLRFSNRMFFLDQDNFVTTRYVVGAPISDPAAGAFDAAVRLLVNATADYATGSSSRRFATGEVGFGNKSTSNNPRIYALAQCTPDNRVGFCRTCFSQIIGQLPEYFSGRNGGGIFGTWCILRYEVYPFFSGRPLLLLPPFVATSPAPAPAPPATRTQDKSRNKAGAVLKVVMPTIAALLAITVICFWTRRRRSAAQYFRPYSASSDDIQGADMPLLDLSTLRIATDDFAESKMLGKGGFGMVYKGVLPDGQEIAVKRLCQSSRQGIGELKSELVLVAKLHHKNLVRLVGVCLQEDEKILVYEYMPNRSLDMILFDSVRNKELDWGKRFKIINGIARGLQYLHEDSQLKIVHRDLKASNILLDSDYVPKISDFGLAKIFGGDRSKYVTHRVAGTYFALFTADTWHPNTPCVVCIQSSRTCLASVFCFLRLLLEEEETLAYMTVNRMLIS
ncbi:hypothetical protein SEVIR_3G083200v4 [Setaria viridis]|uniref:non-specific serine/threonine protein kinase n=1 Tax=Setaria viridis TaxID=4556 RepID=A0A4U6VKU3_SETVI|nr:cysteine-rich receptor-like protein kinase 6 isoform X2 [Setaria viridis]TKW24937.1 hypothetical protein SEVIR_3G083200v2 [Setaria viridis]